MGDEHHSPEYYADLKKKINAVGIILIVGTVLTFAADLFDIGYYLGGFGYTILVAMFVAIIKATGVNKTATAAFDIKADKIKVTKYSTDK